MKTEEGDLSQFYYVPDEIFAPGNVKVSDIADEFDPEKKYPSVVDRFFTRYYYIRPDRQNEDHMVLLHSNRICLMCLAPGHVAFEKGIASVTYDIGNYDRSKNAVSGKRKKGGMHLQPGTALALVTCSDGSEYKVVSGITGKLIEVNQRIVDDPSRMGSEGEGYVAIVLSKIEKIEGMKTSLLSEEQYRKIKNVK